MTSIGNLQRQPMFFHSSTLVCVCLHADAEMKLPSQCLLDTFSLTNLLRPPFNIGQPLIQLLKFPNLGQKRKIRHMERIRDGEHVTSDIFLLTEDIVVDVQHLENLLTSLCDNLLIRNITGICISTRYSLWQSCEWCGEGRNYFRNTNSRSKVLVGGSKHCDSKYAPCSAVP